MGGVCTWAVAGRYNTYLARVLAWFTNNVVVFNSLFLGQNWPPRTHWSPFFVSISFPVAAFLPDHWKRCNSCYRWGLSGSRATATTKNCKMCREGHVTRYNTASCEYEALYGGTLRGRVANSVDLIHVCNADHNQWQFYTKTLTRVLSIASPLTANWGKFFIWSKCASERETKKSVKVCMR